MIAYIGLCVGASTVSCVKIHKKNNELKAERLAFKEHHGEPFKAVNEILSKIEDKKIALTVTGRKFRERINAEQITESSAIEYALEFDQSGKFYEGVCSLGGETFALYELDAKGKISGFDSKNQCASGTGEFFMQQIRRMGLGIDEINGIASGAKPYKVSGRCSVFAKSDCTHALNKGVPIGEVSAGLAEMIADKVMELIQNKKHKNMLLIGGG